jgi:5-methylcytosine-specific restriction endonuclease McrA
MANQRQKERIYERDGLVCRYCGRNVRRAAHKHDSALNVATIDHFKSKHGGGADEDKNLVVACRGCNTAKGSHDPAWFFLTLRLQAFEDMLAAAADFSGSRYVLAKASFERLDAEVKRAL